MPTVIKLDAKATQALLDTFSDEMKLEFQRCVIKEIVSKSFANDLKVDLAEELKSSLNVMKEEIRKHTDEIIEQRKQSLLDLVIAQIDSIVVNDTLNDVDNELVEKLILKIMSRSTIGSRLKCYEEDHAERLKFMSNKAMTTYREIEELRDELKKKAESDENTLISSLVSKLSTNT